ncbi:MAG: UvrD-helicase domain-containing protein [Pseudomonadota bacterium]|nr:UvrD-helicase domain-containing protein [Pseudomonadota bacterium]
MRSPDTIILASAGSGKTTHIVDTACADNSGCAALVTYTINGKGEFSKKAYEQFGAIPKHVILNTWYTFLLRNFVRPYQNHLYAPRVAGINFKRGQSARYVKATDVERFYFSSPGRVYLDKVSQFACAVIEKTNGLPIKRFEAIYDRLFIDEAQDLSGYDLNLLEHLLRSNVKITLVGDHRQATYTTNDNSKNKRYARAGIVEKFKEWEKDNLCTITYQTHSHRCIQAICDFADQFHPEFPKTESRNRTTTEHDGVFLVEESRVPAYMATFNPQTLRYNRAQTGILGNPLNFGASKGMTFDRTLIYPHGPLKKFLKTGKLHDAGKEIPKIYIAVTRAKQSVAFVVPDRFESAIFTTFQI